MSAGGSWGRERRSAALLLLPIAALLLRGCPVCWLFGLAERLRALSTQRG